MEQRGFGITIDLLSKCTLRTFGTNKGDCSGFALGNLCGLEGLQCR